MIKLEQVSKNFGKVKAVDNISFEVREGETMVLLGTSGCGKTTTLRMLNRLIEPTSGKITINGKDILAQPQEQLRRNIGYVLQHNSLFPHYTVAENIAAVPHLLKWDKQKIVSRSEELMHKVNLTASYLTSYPRELSGGQQQRVNIARALAANPDVLLMDEPFGALDTITRASIRKEFSELDELKRKTIVMVTHDVQEAFEMGDEICLMNEGKIMQKGKPAELLFHPANDFVCSFFSSSYLQLVLKTVQVNDIWDVLEETVTGRPTAVSIQYNEPLWQVMERLMKDDAGSSLMQVSNKQGATKMVRREALYNAISNYKAK